MDFLEYLKLSALEIDQKLDDIFLSWRKEIKHLNPKVLNLLEVSIQASKGGKRLRGTLVKLGYEITLRGMGGEALHRQNPYSIKDILTPAAAYEVCQTAILAHDDIIDKSPLRRGLPTIYKRLGSNHYAISQAICLGDIGFFLAFQIISSSNFSGSQKSLAIKSFSKTMIDTAFGQMLDIELSFLPNIREEGDVISISKYKTAWYTLVGPLQLGAALAGANEELLQSIKVFGENLGIAFQIQDDILGVFGEEKVLGKSTASDIKEGKNTLLITQALKKSTPTQRKTLQSLYGKEAITPDEVEKIKEIFIQTKALDYSKEVALKYTSLAKKQIPKITQDPKMKDLLEQMADYLVRRNK